MFNVKGYRDFKYVCNSNIRKHLWDDWFNSYSNTVQNILNHPSHPHIQLFYGDKDYICNWRGGEFLAHSLDWYGKKNFEETEYKKMTLNKTVYGKYKRWEGFTFMRVDNAGHSVPEGQPFFAERMLESFIEYGFQDLN
eukprot:TRINITY_DN3978_c0_g1_i2.p1 TRINITY_DN3978_c0_g1~~TRINITY_DN3978_c0_g1_i2.p1  ORF type:complete len:138 (+),score=24.13 TRINITY_DN3978_c0_g1_i2:143-556(+)